MNTQHLLLRAYSELLTTHAPLHDSECGYCKLRNDIGQALTLALTTECVIDNVVNIDHMFESVQPDLRAARVDYRKCHIAVDRQGDPDGFVLRITLRPSGVLLYVSTVWQVGMTVERMVQDARDLINGWKGGAA